MELAGVGGASVNTNALNTLDPRSLDNLRRSARTASTAQDQRAAIRQAAKQVESLFLEQLMKSMRAALPQTDPLDGPGQAQMQSMLDGKLAGKLSERGIGLSDAIARQLERASGLSHQNEHLAAVPSQAKAAIAAETGSDAPKTVAEARARIDAAKRELLARAQIQPDARAQAPMQEGRGDAATFSAATVPSWQPASEPSTLSRFAASPTDQPADTPAQALAQSRQQMAKATMQAVDPHQAPDGTTGAWSETAWWQNAPQGVANDNPVVALASEAGQALATRAASAERVLSDGYRSTLEHLRSAAKTVMRMPASPTGVNPAAASNTAALTGMSADGNLPNPLMRGAAAAQTAGVDESLKGGAGDVIKGFVKRLWSEAKTAEKATGLPAHFILGQAALETGWGRFEMRGTDGARSFNMFGIKAGSGWKGATVDAVTTEYINGKAKRVVERFRAYGSYAEAFKDYADFLASNPRFQPTLASAQSPEGFARSLQRAGYATDPAYAEKLTRVIEKTLKAAV